MIFVNQDRVSEDSFVSLLEATKVNIDNSFAKNIPNGINGIGFESVVYNEMLHASKHTDFHGHIEQTGLLSFPDIVARKLYGVEVKMTIGDKWVSTGNSVLETTRIDSVETIYMFFGKFGKSFEARYRKYQDCLSDVGVTHSPRYKIDMNLADGNSIFHKIGVPYDEFRKEAAPIQRLKNYYRERLKKGEELWWIDPTAEETTVSPIIKPFRLLSEELKNEYISKCMILFPEIFGKSRTKFERAAGYLIANYNAVSSNLRDNFTSGGKMQINIDGKPQLVERILYNLFLRSTDIADTINTIPHSELAYYWDTEINNEPIIIWQELLSQHLDFAVAVFNNGLIQ